MTDTAKHLSKLKIYRKCILALEFERYATKN